jgi:hypothetical protein
MDLVSKVIYLFIMVIHLPVLLLLIWLNSRIILLYYLPEMIIADLSKQLCCFWVSQNRVNSLVGMGEYYNERGHKLAHVNTDSEGKNSFRSRVFVQFRESETV